MICRFIVWRNNHAYTKGSAASWAGAAQRGRA
jgi:hypothetical protein